MGRSGYFRTLLIMVSVALLLACGESPVPPAAQPDGGDASPDSVVVFENPGGTPVQANVPTVNPEAATPQGFIVWTTEPSFSDWTLTAAGVLQEGASLVDTQEERAPAFLVYYKGHTDPMVVLLPDLPLGQTWDTDHTIAPTNFEQAGQNFSFEASSPLFGDTSGALELHAVGYDSDGKKVVLSVITIR